MIHPILNKINKQGHLKAIILFIILWVIFFYKFFFFNQIFYLGDSIAIDLPYRIYLIDSLRNGEIPLWNPLILTGIPFMLIGSQGMLNPGTLFFFVLSPETAMTLITLLNILLSGIFMYFFIYLLTKKYTASFFAGLVYMFSGFAILSTMAITITQELPFVPLAFIAVELSLVKKKKIYLLFAGLILALQFISGFPFAFYLTALGAVIYYLASSEESFIKRILAVLFIGFFTAGFSAFLLLPQLEAALYSTRPLADYLYATGSSLHPFNLITFIFPHFFGIKEIETVFNTLNKNYLGIIPLFLTLYMIFCRRSLLNKGLMILTILGFFLSFGRYFPLYKIALLVPGLSLFREPDFFLLWFVFGASYISGVGLDYLVSNKKSLVKFLKTSPGKIITYLILLIFLLLLFVLFFFLSTSSSFWIDFISLTQKIIFPYKSLSVLLLKTGKIKSLFFINLSSLVFTFSLLTIVLLLLPKLKKQLSFIFLILITFLDLFFLNQSNLFFLDKKIYRQITTPEDLTRIAKNDNFRIHSIARYLPPDWNNFSIENYLLKQIKRDVNILWPNRNLSLGIASIDGFSPLFLKSQADFFTDKSKDLFVGISGFDISLLSEKIGQSAASYILSDEPMPEYQPPRYLLLENNPPYYYLYQDTNARKRAFLLNENNKEIGSVDITSAGANSVSLTINSPEEADLILLDTYYPGWEAFVDGKSRTITLFENTFRRISVPTGNHIILFTFKPKSLIYGSIITMSTLVLFVIIIRRDKKT